MRVLAPVPFVMREVQEDFVYCMSRDFYRNSEIKIWFLSTGLGNQLIRKGTTVYIFIHGIHYDANVFPHPEKFDPERFSHQHNGNKDQRSPYAYIPFSAGSRNCIGKWMSSYFDVIFNN